MTEIGCLSNNAYLCTNILIQLTTIEKAGYLTITANADNTGVVYVGDVNVDNDSYNLEAGSSVLMELDDLSKIYCYASEASQAVDIIGGWKY